jgi:hypothetical protein
MVDNFIFAKAERQWFGRCASAESHFPMERDLLYHIYLAALTMLSGLSLSCQELLCYIINLDMPPGAIHLSTCPVFFRKEHL